jgi:uncharacterized membrane protein (DUF485 family)
MSSIISIILITLQARFTITANRLLSFVRGLPLLKKAINPTVYGNRTVKQLFTVLGALWLIKKKLLMLALYIGVLLLIGFLSSYTATPGETPSTGVIAGSVLIAWFILSVIGGITTSVVSSADHDKDEIMVNYLRANAATYAKAQIMFSLTVDVLLYIPFLLIAFLLADVPLWGIVTTLCMFAGMRLCGEVVNFAMFKRFKKHFGRGWVNAVTGITLITVAIIFPRLVFVDVPNLNFVFANPVFAAIGVALGILAWRYIKRYTLYLELIREKIHWFRDAMNKYKANTAKTASAGLDIDKWSKGLTDIDLCSAKHESKHGFAYLNAIFFDRHSKYFAKKLRIRVLICLALPMFVFAGTLAGILTPHEPLTPAEIAEIEAHNCDEYTSIYFDCCVEYAYTPSELAIPFMYAPLFFFLIYISSMGRIMTASMFTNCDIHMLHYPYYRTKATILKSFVSRFAAILKYNLIFTSIAAGAVSVTTWLYYDRIEFAHAGVFFVLLTAIGVLFSFNDLFLYYAIQPYDSAGKSKSPVYSVINFVIYIIAWFNFYGRHYTFREFVVYTFGIMIVTAVYVGIGGILLRVLAPRKFKLRG